MNHKRDRSVLYFLNQVMSGYIMQKLLQTTDSKLTNLLLFSYACLQQGIQCRSYHCQDVSPSDIDWQIPVPHLCFCSCHLTSAFSLAAAFLHFTRMGVELASSNQVYVQVMHYIYNRDKATFLSSVVLCTCGRDEHGTSIGAIEREIDVMIGIS